MGAIEVSIEFNEKALAKFQEALEKALKNASEVLVVECRKAADVYTPWKSKDLLNSIVYTETNGVRDGWGYNLEDDYAGYQWYGQRKDGTHVIKNHTLDFNSNARTRWTEHGAITYEDVIVNAVIASLKSQGLEVKRA